MTGNIVGEPIDEFVAKQIDTRQKIYGGGYNNIRTPQQLVFFNSRTSFVKLLSSVDIKEDFKPNSEELKEIIKTHSGPKLAQNFILFNGVSSLPTTTPTTISNNLLNNYQNYAYGLGGYEQGLRPMPGIISINVKNETRGSLKTATINLKAWNRVQFEIIDVLYLRLGYTLLLEWGNNIYFTDPTTSNQFTSNPLSLETDFLKPIGDKVNYETILKKIQDNRQNSYSNYDALVGRIVNFTWEANIDGSYDIIIILRSIGDVIESIKANSLITDAVKLSLPASSQTSSQTSTNIFQPPNANAASDNTAVVIVNAEVSKELANKNKLFVTNISPLELVISTEIGNELNKAFFNIMGVKSSNITLKKDVLGKVIAYNADWDKSTTENTYISQKYNTPSSSDPSTSVSSMECYIRLGSLLYFIQEKVIFKYKSADTKSALKFDLNINTNLIYDPRDTISFDPTVCLIKRAFSSNKVKIKYIYGPLCNDFESSYKNTAHVLNIYVNFNCIASYLDPVNNSTDGRVLLIDFLNSILTNISRALGGINNLYAYIEEETNTVKILDQTPLYNKKEILTKLNKTSSLIPPIILLGYTSTKDEPNIVKTNFVKNFSIKTSITPQLASMLTIGAQARSLVIGEEATALSTLNNGLIDRVKYEVINADEKDNASTNISQKYPNISTAFYTQRNSLAYLQQNKAYTSDIPTFTYNDVTKYTQIQIDFINYNQSKNAITSKTSSGQIGYIPVSLNLELDGISGLKIYNGLNVETRFLPSQYPDTMDFIIINLSHDVINNVWTTKLETIMVPKDPNSTDEEENNTNVEISSGGGTVSSDTFNTLNEFYDIILKGESADYNSYNWYKNGSPNTGLTGLVSVIKQTNNSNNLMPELSKRYISDLTIEDIKNFMNVDFAKTPSTGRNTAGQTKNQLYAIGRYQLTPVTFYDLIKQKNTLDKDKFNPTLQDELGKVLLKSRSSIRSYLSNGSSLDNAVEGLSQIFSSVSKNADNKSYYSDEKATVSFDTAKNALEKLYRSIKEKKITL